MLEIKRANSSEMKILDLLNEVVKSKNLNDANIMNTIDKYLKENHTRHRCGFFIDNKNVNIYVSLNRLEQVVLVRGSESSSYCVTNASKCYENENQSFDINEFIEFFLQEHDIDVELCRQYKNIIGISLTPSNIASGLNHTYDPRGNKILNRALLAEIPTIFPNGIRAGVAKDHWLNAVSYLEFILDKQKAELELWEFNVESTILNKLDRLNMFLSRSEIYSLENRNEVLTLIHYFAAHR